MRKSHKSFLFRFADLSYCRSILLQESKRSASARSYSTRLSSRSLRIGIKLLSDCCHRVSRAVVVARAIFFFLVRSWDGLLLGFSRQDPGGGVISHAIDPFPTHTHGHTRTRRRAGAKGRRARRRRRRCARVKSATRAIGCGAARAADKGLLISSDHCAEIRGRAVRGHCLIGRAPWRRRYFARCKSVGKTNE